MTLTIHDVAGRRVQTLLDAEPLAAGPHTAVWSGCDDAGRLAPAGVYLYTLRAGEFSRTGRMTLVK